MAVLRFFLADLVGGAVGGVVGEAVGGVVGGNRSGGGLMEMRSGQLGVDLRRSPRSGLCSFALDLGNGTASVVVSLKSNVAARLGRATVWLRWCGGCGFMGRPSTVARGLLRGRLIARDLWSLGCVGWVWALFLGPTWTVYFIIFLCF